MSSAKPGDTDHPRAVILVASFLKPGCMATADGGRPRIVRDLARHLVTAGFAVEVVQKGVRDSAGEFEPGILVRTVKAPARAWGDPVFAWRSRRLMRAAALCCYASPEDGYPFFATGSFAIQHGVWWDGPEYKSLRGWLVQIAQRVRSLAMCRRARFVLCVDSNFGNWLRTLGPAGHEAARKCLYVPNYVDTDRFPMPSDSDIRRRFRRRKLLFLRRLEPPRGALLFVETCRYLRDQGFEFTADLVGWGTQTRDVWKAVAQYGLDERVRNREVNLDEVPQALDDASLSVIPSLWSEGTSLSAVESIAMGVPVVTTAAGGLPNVVIPNFNGRVTLPTGRHFGEAVIELMTNEQGYFEAARNCLAMREALSFRRWTCQVDRALRDAGLLAPQVVEAAHAQAIVMGEQQ